MITGRYDPELEAKIPWKKWTEYEGNPVVSPLFGDVVADPTVIVPQDASMKECVSLINQLRN